MQPGKGTRAGFLRTALAALAVLIHVCSQLPVRAEEAARATAAALSGDATRTTFRLDLTSGVTAEIFTLADPYRVIVDLPDVAFGLPEGTGEHGRGLVKAFRYGLFAERKARIVLDTEGPVRIERAAMTAEPSGKGIIFTFDILTTAPENFGAGTGAAREAEAREREAAAAQPPTPPPGSGAPSPAAGKAIIMIDPGHGGIDGGAVGTANVREKDVVLAVGKELQRQLAASGRYDVRMTRSSDVFISLDQRLNLSLAQEVNLFISLHADSLDRDSGAGVTRGATIYTLSERASDEHARRMAEKENASDLVAGLSVTGGDEDEQVMSILIDLMKRETANFSADISNALVGKMRNNVRLSRVPQRSAAFKVLKQTHAPSVLIELGYLSHADDEKLLASPEWHKKVASSIKSAIDTYFAKRTAGTRTR